METLGGVVCTCLTLPGIFKLFSKVQMGYKCFPHSIASWISGKNLKRQAAPGCWLCNCSSPGFSFMPPSSVARQSTFAYVYGTFDFLLRWNTCSCFLTIFFPAFFLLPFSCHLESVDAFLCSMSDKYLLPVWVLSFHPLECVLMNRMP